MQSITIKITAAEVRRQIAETILLEQAALAAAPDDGARANLTCELIKDLTRLRALEIEEAKERVQ